MGVKMEDVGVLAKLGRRLGQDLLDPPNVKGWSGGTAWINARTLLVRQQAVRRVATLSPLPKRLSKGLGAALSLSGSPAKVTQGARALLLAPSPSPAPVPGGTGADDALGALLLSPAYQLI